MSGRNTRLFSLLFFLFVCLFIVWWILRLQTIVTLIQFDVRFVSNYNRFFFLAQLLFVPIQMINIFVICLVLKNHCRLFRLNCFDGMSFAICIFFFSDFFLNTINIIKYGEMHLELEVIDFWHSDCLAITILPQFSLLNDWMYPFYVSSTHIRSTLYICICKQNYILFLNDMTFRYRRKYEYKTDKMGKNWIWNNRMSDSQTSIQFDALFTNLTLNQWHLLCVWVFFSLLFSSGKDRSK